MQKFKIFPNKMQANQIDKTFWCCQFVYNEMLKRREKEHLNFKQTINILTQMKRDNACLRAVDSVALQQAVRWLDYDYQKFFSHTGAYPQMKEPLHTYLTYNNNNTIRIVDNFIRLPKLGFIRIEPQLENNDIISVMVSEEKKEYYANINFLERS